MDKNITSIGKEGSIVTTISNTRPFDIEQNNRDLVRLAGEDIGLAKKVWQLMGNENYRGAKEILTETTQPNPYLKLMLAQIADRIGYSLLQSGKPDQASIEFKLAIDNAESCKEAFDLDHINREIDALRFSSRKHVGDCKYDKVRGSSNSRRENVEAMEKEYQSAVEVWQSMPKVGWFEETMLTCHLQVSDMYAKWSEGYALLISPNPINMLTDPNSEKLLRKAEKLNNTGLIYIQTTHALAERVSTIPHGFHESLEKTVKDTSRLEYGIREMKNAMQLFKQLTAS